MTPSASEDAAALAAADDIKRSLGASTNSIDSSEPTFGGTSSEAMDLNDYVFDDFEFGPCSSEDAHLALELLMPPKNCRTQHTEAFEPYEYETHRALRDRLSTIIQREKYRLLGYSASCAPAYMKEAWPYPVSFASVPQMTSCPNLDVSCQISNYL